VELEVAELLNYWKEKVTFVESEVMSGLGEQMSRNVRLSKDCEDEESGGSRRASAFPIEAQRWVYIFMGRMLHGLKEQEEWQIIPFLKGRGGSGKSTVATVVKNFFEASDVGILSNNSEKKFGLQTLLDKFVWLCLELKKNVALDQAEFQSMVSGEDVVVAQKNQMARQVTWTAPGLLCGNESPGWIDAQGSIARRMAIITFGYSLQERDVVPDLLKRILCKELPALIMKCNQAYLGTCETSRQDDIWKVLPPYFKKERLRFQKDTDAVYAAVYDSQRFELWSELENPEEPMESYYVASSVIEEHYRQKWRDLMGNNFAEPFTPEKWASAYQSAGIDGPIHEMRRCPILKVDVTNLWCLGIRERLRPRG
jgi:NOL1/NOP2/fmu family ribosome biogenesis protein